ncbi:MAG: protein kinase [Gammaproteobacteria bacterium]|nr:protein kinase [Gammaproteobacteria bacterium]NIM72779.1 protein kinase [Gammaproteobacteria bacterium]NIN38236.1 protein kinase [Gammaproteobacteria bacterium]NIO24527.1 protein kinase [Gammaproteobacteria bacterium]NIO65136.1 protein kinase [Gammaproteobacteria bacterium]
MSNEKRRHNALPEGYRLHWYEIHTILGRGGFGITYLALDTNLNHEVAIKEFLPTDLAMRASDSSIHPISDEHTEIFEWGLNRFINEAQTLAQFRHPNIVLVHSVFEANGTAYMVMEYEKGESLEEAFNQRRLTTEKELLGILFPLMDGLQRIHESGFVHRDIKPKNIYLRADGRPILLDFGSARQALGVETRTLTTLVSPGYAPFEQYNATRESDKQGPWTDIYALGATIYRGMSGKSPVDALARANAKLENNRDILEPAVDLGRDKFSHRFLEAIDRALCFTPEERPQSIAEWRAMFPDSGGDNVQVAPAGVGTANRPRQPIDRDAPTQVSPDTAAQTRFTEDGTLIVGGAAAPPSAAATAKSPLRSPIVILVALVAVIGIAIGVWRLQPTTPTAPDMEAKPTTPEVESRPTAVTAPKAASAKPSMAEVTAILGSIPCSILQASINDRSVLLRGYVAGSAFMQRVVTSLNSLEGVAEVKSTVEEVPTVFCQTLELYAPLIEANRDAGHGTAISTPNADNVFVEGERLIANLKAPTFKSWLYIDYFAHDGSVVHMMPSPGEEFNEADPRESFQIGEPGDIGLWEVAPPFGTEIVVMLATSAPVFEGARGQLEEAADYRAALRKRLAALESASNAARISADLVVIRTTPKS